MNCRGWQRAPASHQKLYVLELVPDPATTPLRGKRVKGTQLCSQLGNQQDNHIFRGSLLKNTPMHTVAKKTQKSKFNLPKGEVDSL